MYPAGFASSTATGFHFHLINSSIMNPTCAINDLRIAHWLEQLDPLECSCGLLTVHHLWRNAHVTPITVQLRLFYCGGESQTSPDWIVCMWRFSASPCSCLGIWVVVILFILSFGSMHFG